MIICTATDSARLRRIPVPGGRLVTGVVVWTASFGLSGFVLLDLTKLAKDMCVSGLSGSQIIFFLITRERFRGSSADGGCGGAIGRPVAGAGAGAGATGDGFGAGEATGLTGSFFNTKGSSSQSETIELIRSSAFFFGGGSGIGLGTGGFIFCFCGNALDAGADFCCGNAFETGDGFCGSELGAAVGFGRT